MVVVVVVPCVYNSLPSVYESSGIHTHAVQQCTVQQCVAQQVSLVHRHNHPAAHVTFNFGDRHDQVYLVPSNACKWLSFIRWTLGGVKLRHFLAGFKGERKQRRVGNRMDETGWRNNGRWGRYGGGKGMGSQIGVRST